MNSALAAVLANPAIWRGGDCAPEPAAMPSGFPALDAVLPGRGWPQALTEILLAREGIGEIRLTLPALVHLQAGNRDVVWIAPPHLPYAPLRLALAPQDRRLAVRVIKRRGGDIAQPVLIDVDAETRVRLDFCGRSANKADEEKSSLTLLSLRSAH